jgi:hypothetical protein
VWGTCRARLAHSRFFFHRALAALRAAAFRCSAVIFAARVAPPLRPHAAICSWECFAARALPPLLRIFHSAVLVAFLVAMLRI